MASRRKVIIGLFSLNGATLATGILFTFFQMRLLGLSREIEIYFLAHVFSASISKIFQSGTISNVLIPSVIQDLNGHNSRKAVDYKFISLCAATLLLSSSIILLIWLSTRFNSSLFSGGLENEELNMFIRIFSFLLICIPLQIVISLIQGYFKALSLFGLQESTNFFAQLFNLLFFLSTFSYFGIMSLVYGLVLSNCIQLFILLFILNKHEISLRGLSLIVGFEEVYKFRNAFTGSLFYTIATQIFVVQFNLLGSHLDNGFYALFKYAQKIYLRLSGLVRNPFITLFYTRASESWRDKRYANISNDASHFLLIQVMFTILAIYFFLLFENELSSLLHLIDESFNQIDNYQLLIITISLHFAVSSFNLVINRLYFIQYEIKNYFLIAAFSQLLSALLCFGLMSATSPFNFTLLFVLNPMLLLVSISLFGIKKLKLISKVLSLGSKISLVPFTLTAIFLYFNYRNGLQETGLFHRVSILAIAILVLIFLFRTSYKKIEHNF